MQNNFVLAQTETRTATLSLLVRRERFETVEDALLWFRREARSAKNLGLTMEARSYSIDGGATWLKA